MFEGGSLKKLREIPLEFLLVSLSFSPQKIYLKFHSFCDIHIDEIFKA